MEECREAITALQAECDEINGKIFDPDQVQEIMEELTNQLIPLADKMKSADSWQKGQLVRIWLRTCKFPTKMRSPSDERNLLKTSLTKLLRTELGLVRPRRLELPRRNRHMHLKHACLPIPARALTGHYTIHLLEANSKSRSAIIPTRVVRRRYPSTHLLRQSAS